MPPGIASLDLDVIKLTAQFAARNGKGFLSGLASREHANPQFNFLKPTHSMFGIFTSLADAYSRVLKPPPELDARLRKDEDKSGLLERALQRLEWERSQDAAKAKADDEAEKEREAMALIDWHDFQVVETIDFLDEEDDEFRGASRFGTSSRSSAMRRWRTGARARGLERETRRRRMGTRRWTRRNRR